VGKKRQVFNQELKRGIYRGETVAGVIFGRRKEKASVLTRGPLLSAG
jgi:hypothetical protein